jgi:hypothetical protein
VVAFLFFSVKRLQGRITHIVQHPSDSHLEAATVAWPQVCHKAFAVVCSLKVTVQCRR